jgi:FAD/FMN-containing dehydrogenase
VTTFELPPDFERELRAEFPGDFLTTDPADLETYGRDWTRVFTPAPSGVARPRSTDEVQRLLAACQRHQVPVVPSGGRTGLAGGAVASQGELVLSLERLRAMGAVDGAGQTLVVQAGAVTQAVHEHAAEAGLTWPIDLASKGSCQIGGNVATNAGGVRVIRYGHTRNWVLGLEVVTAGGDVLRLNGALEKNNTGLDLRQLFIGSEGTLGVVTEVTLKLTRLPERAEVLLFAVADMPRVLALLELARKGPFVIGAFECFSERCLRRVCDVRKVSRPFPVETPYYVLLEAESAAPDRLDGWLLSTEVQELVAGGTLAQDNQQRARLWLYRESITESIGASAFPHKNDIALPVRALPAFCRELEALFAERYPDWEICLFGHVGDGNLHVNTLKPPEMATDDFLRHARAADDVLFSLVGRHGGSIAAEHGVGLVKKPFLHYSRSPAELAVLRDVKRALDPTNLLNPGKIFDL